jgi:drug/metabolite transporter (DMT)-like permease
LIPRTSTPEVATPVSAILLVVSACFLFSFLDASAKYLVLQGMEAPFVAWARFAIHLVLVSVLFRIWSNMAVLKTANLPGQVLRGVFMFGSTVLNFFALQTLQLGETIAISFFAPMLTVALAGPLLGEWAGWRRWLAIIVGFVGVLIVTRPGFGEFRIGYVYSFGFVICHTLYVIMTRRMGATESSESLIFYSALTPTLFMLPAVPLYGSVPQGALQWGLLLVTGVCGSLGHWLLIKAYKQATASSLAPYPYSQIVWMIGLGWLAFGDLPDFWTLFGAGVIIASGLYIIHREHRLRLASRAAPGADERELAKKL